MSQTRLSSHPEGVLSDEKVDSPGSAKISEEKTKEKSDISDKRASGDVPEGLMWAGPGDKRLLIHFDVRALFEEKPVIKDVGKRNNMTFRITGDSQIMKEILKAHGFTEVPINCHNTNFSWIGNSVDGLIIDQLLGYQSINHFSRSTCLTRKDMLYKNVKKLAQKKGPSHVDFMPVSFVLPKEKRKFKSYFKKHSGPFIVKPVGLSRGRGVYIIDSPKDIIKPYERLIVSRYIQNPLLLDGYKIDLRIYVLVTSFSPLVIYIYQEGLTRFATVRYKPGAANHSTTRMHLTNYSINVTSGNYIKNEDPALEDFGSKWTLSALLRYFHAKGLDTLALMSKIEDLIIKTIISVEKPMAKASRIYQRSPHNCFEIFGFDIMLDENYKAWLLEVNLSPSLVCTSPLDIKVKGNMLCDLLNLVGLECYQRKKPVADSCCAGPSRYYHRTVGYYLICLARDALRQLFLKPRKKKQFKEIIATYKSNDRLAQEKFVKVEKLRANMLNSLAKKKRDMIRRVTNEQSRAGGWVKIFPTPDSWQKYRDFMQYPTAKNVVLHHALYPAQHCSYQRQRRTLDVSSLPNSKRDLLKNSKSMLKKPTSEVLQVLERVERYQTSLEIGPPPLFTVKPCHRDQIRMDEDEDTDESPKSQLLKMIDQGCLFTEVQARTAFLKYLTNMKNMLREAKVKPFQGTSHPPVVVVQDLLYEFLGQCSDLVMDTTVPATEYTLDSCLTNFIYHYHKETRQLAMTRGVYRVTSTGGSGDQAKSQTFVNPELFEQFVHSANPWVMEEVIMTYFKKHEDNANIFLRNRIQNAFRAGGNSRAMSTNGLRAHQEPRPGDIWTVV